MNVSPILACIAAVTLAASPSKRVVSTSSPPPPPPQQKQVDPKNVMIARCVYLVIYTGGACLAAYLGKCLVCSVNGMFSNHNWQLSNADWVESNMMPLISATTNLGPVRLQAATGLGSVWTDKGIFNIQRENVDGRDQVVVTLMRDGTNVTTIRTDVPTNSPTESIVVVDFRPWMPPETNCPPIQYLRLAE